MSVYIYLRPFIGLARILEWVAFPFSRGSSQHRSPTLQADSLPPEPQGKPKNTGVGSLSLLQGIFLIQGSTQGLLHYRQIPYQLNYQGPRQHIKKQRHYSADKSLSSQSYGFSSSHVWMWELGHKESWVLNYWCFWIVVLEKTLESSLDCKEIKPIILKKINPEYSLEALILWSPDAKNWLIRKDPDSGKDWRQEENEMTEDEMVGWHHPFDGHEFDQPLGVGDGWGGPVHCSPWGCRVGHDWATVLISQDRLLCINLMATTNQKS